MSGRAGGPVLGRRLSSLGLVAVLWIPWAQGAQGQEADLGPESYARRGMFIGAATGGVLGGLGLGVLASAFCESGQECDTAFRDGFVIGALAGGVTGGLTGLVIGAAIPRERVSSREGEAPGPSGPWSLRVSGGYRWAGDGVVEGPGGWAGVAFMRPTSATIRWGIEAAYLGGEGQVSLLTVPGRDGTPVVAERRWDRDLWSLALVASRVFRPGSGEGPYLLANAGLYPALESGSFAPLDAPLSPDLGAYSESSVEPYPGIGVGGGGVWRTGDRTSVGVEGRFHLLLGAGDGRRLPMVTLGAAFILGF